MDNPAVVLLSEVYGTLKEGISTIYRRLVQVFREHEPDTPVFSAVLKATEEDEEDAKSDGVRELLLPKVESDDQRTTPSVEWLTFDHRHKYPHLPSKVKTIVGHTDGTSRAACRIKQDRCPGATVVLVIDDIPEESEQYKGDEEAMGIGKKEDSILKDAEEADVVFSIGDRIFDHFKNQFRAIPANKRPQHMKLVPRPSRIFEDANAEYGDTDTMVVLCISKVAGEKLNGLDLAVEALNIVAKKIPIKIRVGGVQKEDKQAREAIRELRKSANLEITFLLDGTQKDICTNMLQAHLVLVPSRAEPFGFVGLEAIAAGVPVLVSDKSGLANLINTYAPRYHNCIVKTDGRGNEQRNATHWANCIEKVLDHCKAEFETAASLKETLLSSRYWEESERQFIDICTSEASRGFGNNNSRTQDNDGSLGSSSDEESLLQEHYRVLEISDKIFDEEVLNDPQNLKSRLSAFKQHADNALDLFKLSCNVKLRVKEKIERRARYHAAKVHRSLFSVKELESRYGEMVECFNMFGATLKKIVDGCVLCSLEFDDTPHLASFLRGYRDGKLSETLTQVLITEEMKLEGGTDLYVHVTLLAASETLSSSDKEEEITLQAFKRLSIVTGPDQLRDIAIKLGFEETSTDSTKPKFSSHLVFDTLRAWREREGKAATLSALAQHLRQLHFERLADVVFTDTTESSWQKTQHTSEERGAVGGQEPVGTPSSVTKDFDVPIIDKAQLRRYITIGHGALGSLEKAYHVDMKRDVAVRKVAERPFPSPAKEASDQELLYSEARILMRASQSDFVISLLGVCLEPHLSIVMPYMENGSLANVQNLVYVPWALRWRIAHEISMGMTFLHEQIPQILHCNLKAQHVLLDDGFHVKIAGFGMTALMAQKLRETGTISVGCTPLYAAPEVLESLGNLIPTTKVDVYSFGVMLWEIMTRRRPYEGLKPDLKSLIRVVVTKKLRPDMAVVPENLPHVDTVSKLMHQCWSTNPHDRPSFNECEEQLREVNNRSSEEDMVEAVMYAKMIMKTTKAPYIARQSKESMSLMSTGSHIHEGSTGATLYDAYICHCDEDFDFVKKMAKKLEKHPFGTGKTGLRLYITARDAVPAMPLHEVIIQAIDRSRYVVIVLSPEALASGIRRFEFEMNYTASLPPEVQHKKVIPVMYKKTDLPSWLKTMHILDYVKEKKISRDWFWRQLAKAISNP